MQTHDRETRQAALAQSLMTEATKRYGAERAEALRSAIEDTAGQLADVALFPIEREEGPSFNQGRIEGGK